MIRTPQPIDERVQAFRELLRSRGLAVTHQRLEVYRCLLEDESHPEADRLFARVRRGIPTISLGTVYKTLDTLKQLGAITEVHATKNATRYEAILEPHHHLVCERCGSIFDLYERKYSRLRPTARAAAGFEVRSCSVQFRGLCRECAATSSEKHSSRTGRS